MKKAILCLILFLLSQFFLPKINGSSDYLVQVFKGNGSIFDIKTGGQINLTDKQLLNILIIAEGYTRTEHDNGKFTNDVQSWIRETELVEPLKSFKDAFVKVTDFGTKAESSFVNRSVNAPATRCKGLWPCFGI